jgi:hypothetical protein
LGVDDGPVLGRPQSQSFLLFLWKTKRKARKDDHEQGLCYAV